MSKLIILCVDDETMVLKSIRDQLKRHFGNKDYVIEIAEGAEEALEFIEELDKDQKKIVIVISDWLMPGMKGDEFLFTVHKISPDTIKIMLTGQADESAITNAKEKAHLYKCIFKPWDEKYLVDTIEKGISEHDSQ